MDLRWVVDGNGGWTHFVNRGRKIATGELIIELLMRFWWWDISHLPKVLAPQVNLLV